MRTKAKKAKQATVVGTSGKAVVVSEGCGEVAVRALRAATGLRAGMARDNPDA